MRFDDSPSASRGRPALGSYLASSLAPEVCGAASSSDVSDALQLASAKAGAKGESITGRWSSAVRAIGPGLVSGAADADPTTVATLAVIGAGTTYGLAWLVLLLFPMIAVVQVISTHVGAVSGRDLQTAIVEGYGSLWRWLLMGSILMVTIITIGADLEGGAAAIGLLTGTDWRWFVFPMSLALLMLLVLGRYHHLQRALKYVLLCLAGYAAAAVLAHPNWAAIARGTLVPRFRISPTYMSDALSLLGTTLTSYVYVWQTIGQVEQRDACLPLRARKLDAVLGSFFATAVFWLILVATGATLGVQHLRADTAGRAAQALRPVAGPLAGDVFALGLLASAVVALPVLMATTAYVTGAQMQWRRGLTMTAREAPQFYAALVAATVLGAGIALSGVSPFRLLFLAGIVGGVATPLGLILLLAAAGNRSLMGGRPISRLWQLSGWLTCLVTSAASLVFVLRPLAQVI
jgi:Mn2+/Fe2+ NRAMP family transporter